MTLRDRLRAAGFGLVRRILALRRASGEANGRGLVARGESVERLVVRDAVSGDIPALAALHVAGWNDAYAPLMTGPPVSVRSRQWQEAFDRPGGWFCLVLIREDGGLVGFAKGVLRPDHPIPGELSKLFLAREYHGLGLGLRLVRAVAGRFHRDGVPAMAAYVDPRNPSCGFFERVGGRWLIEPGGQTNFNWYVWDNVAALAAGDPPPQP